LLRLQAVTKAYGAGRPRLSAVRGVVQGDWRARRAAARSTRRRPFEPPISSFEAAVEHGDFRAR